MDFQHIFSSDIFCFCQLIESIWWPVWHFNGDIKAMRLLKFFIFCFRTKNLLRLSRCYEGFRLMFNVELTLQCHIVHNPLPSPIVLGRGCEPPIKFSKSLGGLDRISIFKGGCCEKGSDLFQVWVADFT